MRSAPVHSVVPISRAAGGGLLLGTLNGAFHWLPATTSSTSLGVSSSLLSRSSPDFDGTGWFTPLPHVPSDACCTSLSWAPGSATVGVSLRGVSGAAGNNNGQGIIGAAGVGMGPGGENLAGPAAAPPRNIILRAAIGGDCVGGGGGGGGGAGVVGRSIGDASGTGGGGGGGGGGGDAGTSASAALFNLSRPGAWGDRIDARVAIGHENAAVMSRAALLRPNMAGRPTFFAGADEGSNCVAVWRARDGCLVQRLPSHPGGGGGGRGGINSGGEIFDVRSWWGGNGGGEEVLASLSRETLQLCTWQPAGGAYY